MSVLNKFDRRHHQLGGRSLKSSTASMVSEFRNMPAIALSLKAGLCLAFVFDKRTIVLRTILLRTLYKLTRASVLSSVTLCFGCLLCLEVATAGG